MGKKKTLHKLGLLLNMFIEKQNTPVMVRQIGSMKLYLTIQCRPVKLGTATMIDDASSISSLGSLNNEMKNNNINNNNRNKTHNSHSHAAPAAPPDRIDILTVQITDAEETLQRLADETAATREKLLAVKQENVMKVLAQKQKQQQNGSTNDNNNNTPTAAMSNSSSNLLNKLFELRKREEARDLKNAITALRLEASATRDDITSRETMIDKAKHRVMDLEGQTLELEQAISEQKLQNAINERAMQDCLVLRKEAIDEANNAVCLIS
eukprot:PhM_4_TR17456/c0_g1_i1/m.36637